MGKKSRQRTRTEPQQQPARRRRSARVSPARAGRAAATRPATAAPPARLPRSSRVRSRACPVESDLVALREFVPAGDRAADPARGRDRTGAARARCSRARRRRWSARTAPSGSGSRCSTAYGDPSRDLAAVLDPALDAEPGSMVGLDRRPRRRARGCRTSSRDEPLDVTVHDGFDFWVADVDDADGSMAAALEQANDAAAPTDRLTSVEAAYWTSVGNREYLRWVMPARRGPACSTRLARLHAADGEQPGRRRPADRHVPGARAASPRCGTCRVGTGAEALEEPAARLRAALDAAIADRRAADRRGTRGAGRSGEPSAHASADERATRWYTAEVVVGRVWTMPYIRNARPMLSPPVNTGRALSFPDRESGVGAIGSDRRRG